MTESEWNASSDPVAMLQWLTTPFGERSLTHPEYTISDRRLRLYACACVRQCWPMLTDSRSRKAVEVAERFADVEATEKDLQADHRESCSGLAWVASFADAGIAARDVAVMCEEDAPTLLRDMVSPFAPLPQLWKRCTWCAGDGLDSHEDDERKCSLCKGCGKLPDSIWLTSTVVALAQNAYELRLDDGRLDPDRLAVLADALEDAGCTDAAILNRLRGLVPCPLCTRLGFDQKYGCSVCGSITGKMYSTGWSPRTVPFYRGTSALDILLGKD